MTRGRHRKTRTGTTLDASDADQSPPGQDELSDAAAPQVDQPAPTASSPVKALDAVGTEDGAGLAVRVVPAQADEFTCSRCQLVHHRSRLAEVRGGSAVCRDCV
ncbi:MAG: DUF4193 family protein [Nocardioidaceae bacterium]